MIKAILQLFIISILCFLGGYLLSAWQGKRLSLGSFPSWFQKDAEKIEHTIEKVVEPLIRKYTSQPKPASSSPTKTKEHSPEKEKKEKEKKEKEKKPSPLLLDSLWLVKTPHPLTRYPSGRVYIEGTSPYGPPSKFKEELFESKDMLHLREDPAYLQENRGPYSPFSSTFSFSSPTYWVQLASFESLDKAQRAHTFLLNKNYDIGLYEVWNGNIPVYVLRLNVPVTTEEAKIFIQQIWEREKVKPILVPKEGMTKKLA